MPSSDSVGNGQLLRKGWGIRLARLRATSSRNQSNHFSPFLLFSKCDFGYGMDDGWGSFPGDLCGAGSGRFAWP